MRAISGEKTAFAYSDILSPKALLEAARTTRSIARAGSGSVAVRVAGQQKRLGKGRHLLEAPRPPLYSADNPLAALSAAEKVELLQAIDKAARAMDPRVIQVMASLAGEYEVVLVARSDGRIAADVRPLVRLSVSVIAEQNGRREQGSSGGGGRSSFSYFSQDRALGHAREAVRQALDVLSFTCAVRHGKAPARCGQSVSPSVRPSVGHPTPD